MGPFSFSHTELKMRDSASPEMKGGMGAALLGVKVICPCLFTVQDEMSRYLVIPVHSWFPATRFSSCFGLVGIVVRICGNCPTFTHVPEAFATKIVLQTIPVSPPWALDRDCGPERVNVLAVLCRRVPSLQETMLAIAKMGTDNKDELPVWPHPWVCLTEGHRDNGPAIWIWVNEILLDSSNEALVLDCCVMPVSNRVGHAPSAQLMESIELQGSTVMKVKVTRSRFWRVGVCSHGSTWHVHAHDDRVHVKRFGTSTADNQASRTSLALRFRRTLGSLINGRSCFLSPWSVLGKPTPTPPTAAMRNQATPV